MSQIDRAYQLAKQQYGELGVDTEEVLSRLKDFAISIHCWQGDDVGGFENPDGTCMASSTKRRQMLHILFGISFFTTRGLCR